MKRIYKQGKLPVKSTEEQFLKELKNNEKSMHIYFEIHPLQ